MNIEQVYQRERGTHNKRNFMAENSTNDKRVHFIEMKNIFIDNIDKTPKNYWSKVEDQLMIDFIQKHHTTDWKKIADFLKTKNPQQCAYRYCKLQNDMNKKAWTKDEDIKLVDLVEVYGTNNWETITRQFIKRDPKEVEARYKEKLDPKLKRSKFTDEEDELLIRYHKELGNNWSEIAQKVKNRSPMMIKNRFYTHLRKHIQNIQKENKNQINMIVNEKEITGTNISFEKSDHSYLERLKITDTKNNKSLKIDQKKNSEDYHFYQGIFEKPLDILNFTSRSHHQQIEIIHMLFENIFSFFNSKSDHIYNFSPGMDKSLEKLIILDYELDSHSKTILNYYLFMKTEKSKMNTSILSEEVRAYIIRLIELLILLIRLSKMRLKLNISIKNYNSINR